MTFLHNLLEQFKRALHNARWSLQSEGAMAERVDHIITFLLYSTAILGVLVFALMVFFVVRYSYKKTVHRGNAPAHNTKLEMGLISGLLVLLVGIFAWAGTTFYDLYIPPKSTYDIYVVGKQWMWKFYSPDGTSGINEVHIPVHTTVRLVMTSEDVIHSFFVPDFHVKQDVLPGQYTSVWFQADQPGRHRVLCTQYCGTNHAVMGGWIDVDETQNVTDGGAQAALITTPVSSPEVRGRQLYQRLQCASCHDSRIASAPAVAPRLQNLFGSIVELAQHEPVVADENYLRESILDPNAKVVKGFSPVMPSYAGQLKEAEILDLISYLRSLREAP